MIVTLSIFLPAHAIPIVLSKLTLITLAFYAAYHLSEHKMHCLDEHIALSKQVALLLRNTKPVTAHAPSSSILPQALMLLLLSLLTYACFLFLLGPYAITATLVLISILCIGIYIHRQHPACIPLLTGMSCTFSMLLALPHLLKIHKAAIPSFTYFFLSKQLLLDAFSFTYTLVSALYGISIFHSQIRYNATIAILSYVRCHTPTRASDLGRKSAVDSRAQNGDTKEYPPKSNLSEFTQSSDVTI
jgi:hypothetical protein